MNTIIFGAAQKQPETRGHIMTLFVMNITSRIHKERNSSAFNTAKQHSIDVSLQVIDSTPHQQSNKIQDQ